MYAGRKEGESPIFSGYMYIQEYVLKWACNLLWRKNNNPTYIWQPAEREPWSRLPVLTFCSLGMKANPFLWIWFLVHWAARNLLNRSHSPCVLPVGRLTGYLALFLHDPDGRQWEFDVWVFQGGIWVSGLITRRMELFIFVGWRGNWCVDLHLKLVPFSIGS